MEIVKPGQLEDVPLRGQCHRCECEVNCRSNSPGVDWHVSLRSYNRPRSNYCTKCPTNGCDGYIFLEYEPVPLSPIEQKVERVLSVGWTVFVVALVILVPAFGICVVVGSFMGWK